MRGAGEQGSSARCASTVTGVKRRGVIEREPREEDEELGRFEDDDVEARP